MELVLRASGIAIISLIVLFVLKGLSGSFASFVKVCAILLLFYTVIVELAQNVAEIRGLVSDFIDSDSFVGVSLSVMIKALGIALIARVCADICRECGESGLAQGVESAAGVVILSLSLPILSEILTFASDVLQQGG